MRYLTIVADVGYVYKRGLKFKLVLVALLLLLFFFVDDVSAASVIIVANSSGVTGQSGKLNSENIYANSILMSDINGGQSSAASALNLNKSSVDDSADFIQIGTTSLDAYIYINFTYFGVSSVNFVVITTVTKMVKAVTGADTTQIGLFNDSWGNWTKVNGTSTTGSYVTLTYNISSAANKNNYLKITGNTVNFSVAFWSDGYDQNNLYADLFQATIDYVPVWNSYSDSAHTNPSDNFNLGDTVYMSGSGFVSGYSYKVGYYDGGDTRKSTDTQSADSSGSLSSSYTTQGGDATGTWHAQVYNASLSPPDTYDATNASAIADDSFSVTGGVPEFPAGIVFPFSASLILYAYMRKKVKIGKK